MSTGDLESQPAIVVLAGNSRQFSRTRAAAERLAAALVAGSEPLRDHLVHTIDLAELGTRLLRAESAGTEYAIRRVTSADLLLVATPVFEGAYAGVLKVFLDRLPGGALAGIRTIPVTVSAAAAHRYAADRALRPVLAELGADVVPISFTLQELDLPDVELLARTWVDSYAPAPQES